MLDMACILQSLDLEFNFVHCRYSGRITGWWWSPTSSVQLVRGCATSATPVHPPVMDQPCTVHCTTQCSSPSDMHWSQIQFYALYSAVPVYWTCYEVLAALHFDCALWLHTEVNNISPVLWVWNALFYFKLLNLIFSSFADVLHGTAWSWWDLLRLLQLQIILLS